MCLEGPFISSYELLWDLVWKVINPGLRAFNGQHESCINFTPSAWPLHNLPLYFGPLLCTWKVCVPSLALNESVRCHTGTHLVFLASSFQDEAA